LGQHPSRHWSRLPAIRCLIPAFCRIALGVDRCAADTARIKHQHARPVIPAGFTPVILIHTIAALAALVLGALVFMRSKGTGSHRLSGRMWVALMLATAISSFWIKSQGQFSWIHGLSIFTVFGLGGAVYYAITGNIARHQRIMKGLFAGGLVSAGAFTLLPQRLLGRMLWSALGMA